MRKNIIAILLIVFCAATVFAEKENEQEFIINFGLQPQGTFSYHGDHNTNFGITTGFEYFKYIHNMVALGGGTSYDTPRSFQDNLDGSLSFMPFYATFKLRPPLKENETNFPFFVARLGYSALITYGTDWIKSSSGGTYYSIGAGINLRSILLEGVYSVNTVNFTEEGTDKKYNEQYSTFSIKMGFKFH